ncbi:MAG: 30S ribosome-binding factor RbfA [Gammaproteobacteria bacterium]|nr:30S ribosome-binding factor RbfA [Gammaproteobacteria bacterium]
MNSRGFARHERVAAQLRRDLATLIQQEVKDPEVGFVSVSDVEVTRDLGHAKVYVTVFDSDTAKVCVGALNRSAGFLRTRLGQQLRMRSVPELHFHHDTSVEQGAHMDALISSLNVQAVDEEE